MTRSLLLSLLLVLTLPACKKKPVGDGMDAPGPLPDATEAVKPGLPDHVQQMVKNFERVFFEFDSAILNAESKSALDANAALMGQYTDLKVEVQGNADERGTTDYNLALGQKRSDAVVAYLTAKGISSSRVKSVSYGEERPLDTSGTEHAWAQNRRAEFVVTWKSDAPVEGTAG